MAKVTHCMSSPSAWKHKEAIPCPQSSGPERQTKCATDLGSKSSLAKGVSPVPGCPSSLEDAETQFEAGSQGQAGQALSVWKA